MRQVAFVVALATAVSAHAQGLPAEPITAGDGRIVVSADVTATVAPADPGFFNFTDYEYNALRNFRLGVAVEFRPSARLQVLTEVRLDGSRLRPHALFLRVRPWPDRQFDVQAGRIPPTFGAYGHRSYGADSLLPGQPLAYQYLTSLHSNAVPYATDDLIRMRGRGWQSSFPVGDPYAGPGLPIVNTTRRDTGLQVHAVHGPLEWTAAVTTGSLSNPRVDDDNDGRQLAARIVLRPSAALALGGSLAEGAYLDRSIGSALPDPTAVHRMTQRAVGIDGEYSVGHFLARAEAIWSRWDVPAFPGPHPVREPLAAAAVMAEGRYTLWPGIYAAARVEHLGFSRIEGRAGRLSWDAPVDRIEIGGGWSLQRNLQLKASWQHNRRDGGRIRRASLVAAQLFYWF